MLATYSSSYPASAYDVICSRWSAGSFPATTESRVICSVTSSEACSKCSGVGRIWAISPGSPALGHSRWACSQPSSWVGAKATLAPACAGLPPEASLNLVTSSSSGAVLMKPSPIFAARSVALGPNPET